MALKYVDIEHTNGQYQICSDGKVYRMYKRTNGGGINYEKSVVATQAYITNNKFDKRFKPFVSLYINKKIGGHWLLPIIQKHFNLQPPDKFHRYVLTHKDGNAYNNELSNLVFKIVACNREFKHYPQPFYNRKKEITHKICAECGVKKPIDSFQLQEKSSTYKNNCNPCISDKQWAATKADQKRLAKSKAQNKIYYNSEKGKIFRTKYFAEDRKRQREMISKRYVAGIFRLSVKELDDQTHLAYKEYFKLKRLLKK